MKSFVLFSICVAALLLPARGSASVIYTSGPDNQLTAPDITTLSGAGRFTLANDAVLTQIDFANWVNQGTTPATVDWAITTDAGSGVLFHGEGAALTDIYLYSVRVNPTFDVYTSEFSVPSLALTAGTYWLQLSNCGTANESCGWGVTNDEAGPDVQFNNGSHNIGKYSFTLEDGPQTPEPSTWLTLGSVLAGMTGVMIRRRKSSV